MPTSPSPIRSTRRGRIVPVVAAAAVVSFVAAVLEIRQVALVWKTCELDSAGVGFFLMLFHLPLLVVAQTAVVTGVALPLMGDRLRADRVLLVTASGLVALAASAVVYFLLQGFPVTNEFCPTPQPDWWPGS
ncbi:hypothetical protein ACPFP2_29480 [Micromonospora citrea]|uniref:hypothetical protein n=1 Tax=Micromonospora citrea TaxID=47855 RepID=UPI003C61B373